MDLESEKGLYAIKDNKTDHYFYITKNTGYELLGYALAIDKHLTILGLGRVLTISDLIDKTYVWYKMEKSNDFKSIIKSLFEKEVIT